MMEKSLLENAPSTAPLKNMSSAESTAESPNLGMTPLLPARSVGGKFQGSRIDKIHRIGCVGFGQGFHVGLVIVAGTGPRDRHVDAQHQRQGNRRRRQSVGHATEQEGETLARFDSSPEIGHEI